VVGMFGWRTKTIIREKWCINLIAIYTLMQLLLVCWECLVELID